MRCTTIPAPSIGQLIAKKTIRFLWAFTVLMFKLIVIFLSRTACFILGIDASDKRQKDPRVERVSVTKNERPVEKIVLCDTKKCVVYLPKSEANFAAKKAWLKSQGYLWHSGLMAWVLPTVRYDNNQPEFYKKISELKKLGYVWNSRIGFWTLTFPKHPVAQANQKKLITEA